MTCFFFASAAVVAGCTDLSSSDLKTAGMSATMTVQGDGTGQTTVTAQFNVDSNGTDFVNLTSGDTATASVASQSRTLSESNDLGDIAYETTFMGEDAEGTLYTIALNRTTDVSAPSSTVTMPSPFSITTPTSSSSLSRTASDITVTYTNSGTPDTMTWYVSGDCIAGAAGTVSGDAGTFVIAKGSLATSQNAQGGTCQATLTLTRTRPGQLDPHYGSGGSINAQHVRQVTFNSTP
jgi:hypothetical protein